MSIIRVCVGSACHLKGSYIVIKKLQELIKKSQLESKVVLKAEFCRGNCTEAVSAEINGKPLSISPDSVDKIFKEEILGGE